MSEKKIWSSAPAGLGRVTAENVLGGDEATESKSDNQKFIARLRLTVGFLMMIAGFYFGLFSTGVGISLGFLTFIAAPFVMEPGK